MPQQNDLPTPVTVNQRFLAKAAGMDVELPTAITMDQMYLQAIAEGSGGGSGDAYTKAQTDALLAGKADLVDGKVPASELPAMSIDSLSDTAVDTPENGEVLKYDADQGKWVNGTASGGGGTTDYTDLTNKPKINNVTLSGNKTASDLGITEMELGETSATAYAGNKGKANADAITAIKDGQSIDSFGDVETALADKVDKVSGKGLSTEDYTTAEKTKLAGIAAGAEVNVQSDWNQTDDTADDFIKNKPNIPAGVVVDQSYGASSTNAQSGVAVAQAVSGKANSADLATVATSGSYADLSNKPTIPDELADLQDDSTHRVVTDAEKTAWSGKQSALVVGTNLDNAPVQGSTNPITSGAIYTGLAGKVDTNGTDSLMTAAEHTKLSGIESGAEVNVQSDWNQTDDTADDYIKNKPTIPAGVVVDQSYSAVSTNAQSGVAVAQAVSGKANSADLATVATSGSYADLSNKPTIPDELADLQDDSTHRVVTDAEKTAWSGKQSALVVGTNLDNTPTQGSTNPITSGAVYTVVGDINTILEGVL